MNLPEDCDLVYIIPDEAWYSRPGMRELPEIDIVALSREGGCAWEFTVTEHPINGSALQLNMFDDSWDAFDQCPELFIALRERRPSDLTQLRRILDDLGTKDATKRTENRIKQ